MLCSLAFFALLAAAHGRAVNISNTWVLPEEGFPVFYRYFRDRISWYEADAVCQFHHANLVTGDGDSSVFAQLKENVPYGNQISKIECKNHVIKNYTSALYKILSNTKLPLYGRKMLKPRLSKLPIAARKMIARNAQDHTELKSDLKNGPLHVFGRHTDCKQYYCKWKSDTATDPDVDLVDDMKKNATTVWAYINAANENVVSKANRLFNETTNIYENLMSIISKLISGKRINLHKRGSYQRRVHVAVDTTAQYDAVRAYLKELDISSAVWVGLIRSNPDGDFTWTDYRGLSGDGYWSSAPDSRSAPLCAAANPTADYRWEARACGGPTVASFICELPVPQWALGNDGCMVRALPALTILYLPESAAVQLTADCGLAGVKRVQCTGNVKRDDLLKDLACVEEEEPSTTPNLSSTGTNWSATTDLTFTDQETTTDLTTLDVITTEHEADINQLNLITTTAKPESLYRMSSNIVSNILMNKNIDLSDNNAQSNFIPKINDVENILTDDQLEKLEDERHMQHKMLHEEIARVGNVENIFTQPTDHFIPPLVMAKAKISDDMTVLSLAEKHAQQLAERQFSKHYENSDHDHIETHNEFTKPHSEINSDKPLITSTKMEKLKDVKKDYKSNIPKKYVNDKFYDAKTKISKDMRTTERDRTTETMTSTETTFKNIDNIAATSTNKPQFLNDQPDEDNSNMDLTIILKESNQKSENLSLTNYTGDIVKLNSVLNITNTSETAVINDINSTETKNLENKTSENITLDHEVIKITIISDDDPLATHKVFEVTTKVPIFKDDVIDTNFKSTTFSPSTQTEQTHLTEHVHFIEETTTIKIPEVKIVNVTVAETIPTTPSTVMPIINEHTSTTTVQTKTTQSDIVSTEQHTTIGPITEHVTLNSTKSNITHDLEIENHTDTTYTTELVEIIAEEHDERNETNTESDDNFQSPLLSAANEPLHRPPRTRRPQQQNRNKFNPFRILG